MKPRVAVKKISDKKLAQHGGRLPWSSIAKRGEKPKARNPKRKAKQFKRAFGSKARVEFVKQQPCAGCGRLFASDNHHIETGGAGRKADADKIVPLCRVLGETSCHTMVHLVGRETFERMYGVNLEAAAAATQRAWLEFTGTTE